MASSRPVAWFKHDAKIVVQFPSAGPRFAMLLWCSHVAPLAKHHTPALLELLRSAPNAGFHGFAGQAHHYQAVALLPELVAAFLRWSPN